MIPSVEVYLIKDKFVVAINYSNVRIFKTINGAMNLIKRQSYKLVKIHCFNVSMEDCMTFSKIYNSTVIRRII